MKKIIFTSLLALIFTSQVQAACLTTTHPYSSGVLAPNSINVVHGPFSVQASKGCRGIIEVGVASYGGGTIPTVTLEEQVGSNWSQIATVRGRSTTMFVNNGNYRVVYTNQTGIFAHASGYTKLSR